jgi:mannose-6-phosphate isomerase-like protein (cupin superfamily)
MNRAASVPLSPQRAPRPLRRWLLPAFTLCCGSLFGVAGARALTPAPAYSIDNAVKSFAKDAVDKTKAGYQFWFFDKEFAQGRTLKLSAVGPHQASHPPHEHDGHEFFFVLEGQAEFFLDGKTRRVGPQTALYAPPHVMHGISNVGDGELRYLVIKDYPWPAAMEQPRSQGAKGSGTKEGG